MWNLDESAVRMVSSGERGWSKKGESAHVFASRAFVTVTLAANMRGGMWTQIVHEGKTDRVHPHGPHFPRQLVSRSPTHLITQNALLNMIDAIDADMHARPGDAELIPFWIVHHGTSRRHFAASCATRAHTSNCTTSSGTSQGTAAGPSVRASLHELDPPRGEQTLRRVLGSRVQLRTCQSGLQHIGAPTAAALIRAHRSIDRSPQHRAADWRFIDWKEVEQRELLAEAKRLLETAEPFPRGTADSRASCRGRSHRQRARGARVGGTGRRSQQ